MDERTDDKADEGFLSFLHQIYPFADGNVKDVLRYQWVKFGCDQRLVATARQLHALLYFFFPTLFLLHIFRFVS